MRQHVDFRFPSPAGPFREAAFALYFGRVRALEGKYGAPLSSGVLALLAMGTNMFVAGLRRADAPAIVQREMAAQFRAAERLARLEAAQRRKRGRQ